MASQPAVNPSLNGAPSQAPRVAELVFEGAGVVSVMKQTQHHMVVTCPTPYHRRYYQKDHHARAEQILTSLYQSTSHVPNEKSAASPREIGFITRCFVAVAKFAVPLTVSFITFRVSSPFAVLLSIHFVACLSLLYRYQMSGGRSERRSEIKEGVVISISFQAALLRVHGTTLRAVPLSNVRLFRAATFSKDILSAFLPRWWRWLPWILRRLFTFTNHDLEVVTLGEPLVLPGFKYAHVAESIATMLNDALHQWHVSANSSAPIDVFDMSRDAFSAKKKQISQSMTLPLDLQYRDGFAVQAAGQEVRCTKRCSSLWLKSWTTVLLFFLYMMLAISFGAYSSKSEMSHISEDGVRVFLPYDQRKTHHERASGAFLLPLVMVCVSLFTFWWTQVFMTEIFRMESLRFVYGGTRDMLRLPKRVLSHFTGRIRIEVQNVSAVEVFRNAVSADTKIGRGCRQGDTYVVHTRYGVRLFQSDGRCAFHVGKLYEDEALHLAQCLRATFAHICAQDVQRGSGKKIKGE